MPRPDLTETEYLRQIERLARGVVDAACGEDWFTYGDTPAEATQLQRRVNLLAREIRRYHFSGDGCLDDEADRPEVRLIGVLVLRPHVMPAGMNETYEDMCLRLGVEPRPDGWALWNTYGENGQAVTMVMTDVSATEGLLANWARGISIYPVTPLPAQIELVRQGWVEPMTFSPRAVLFMGLAGQP
ncbi:MAG: hypothetical protein ABIQ18_09490 [Umezawaea sp.]